MIGSLGEYLKKVMQCLMKTSFVLYLKLKKLSVTHPVARLKQVSFWNLDNIARGDSREEGSTIETLFLV